MESLSAFIWKFVRLQKGRFFWIFFLNLLWVVDFTVWPYILRLIVDTFTQYEGDRMAALSVLVWLLAILAFVWVLVEGGCRVRDFLKAKALPQVEADIRMAMFDHVQRHSPKYFNEHFSGSLANKIADMTTHVSLLLYYLYTFCPIFLSGIVLLLVFSQINSLFSWILALWLMIHFSIVMAFAKKCANYSDIHGEVRSSLAGKIVDSLTNNFTVNLFSRFRFEKERLTIYQKEEQQKNTQARRSVVVMFVVLSILFVIFAAFILNGSLIFCWLTGKISSGEVVQIFGTTVNFFYMVWYASEMIPQYFQSLGIARQALSVMHDSQDLLDLSGATDLVVKKGEIVFEQVTFQYGEQKLFTDKDVRIRGGEKVGLVGYSGAGKSSFVNLILRFYPIQKGKILIDGQDIAQVTLESLRKQVTLIPQDPLLFHRTLEENIRYGRLEATREEVIEAAKQSFCDGFIRRCPQGYDTLVGERGTKLSGGERQRISIARAMLTHAPILLLDEATSALDSVTERTIQESLERLMEGRTTIVIAHRLSTLAKMDRILVFDQGNIIEEGSHTELLSKNGHYAHMWQMQAGGFLPN